MSHPSEIVVALIAGTWVSTLGGILAIWQDNRKRARTQTEQMTTEIDAVKESGRAGIAELRGHFDERLDKQDDATQANITALAVIVPQFQTMSARVDRGEFRNQELSEAVAVLNHEIERHNTWIRDRDLDRMAHGRRHTDPS